MSIDFVMFELQFRFDPKLKLDSAFKSGQINQTISYQPHSHLCDPEVRHAFMAEWIPYKQKHLMELELSDDCCLFADACKVFTDDRECVRHGAACVPCLTNHSLTYNNLNYCN